VAGVLSGRGPVWLGWRWEACPNGLKIAQLQPVTVLTINIYHTYIHNNNNNSNNDKS
jgi:hypothetical protein